MSDRLPWGALPAALRRRVEDVLGAPVADAVSQREGFSPGSADRVRARNGHRAFVKAVGRSFNASTYELLEREIAVQEVLPPSISAAQMLGVYRDEEWIAVILEDVEGRHPATPPTEDETRAVLEAVLALPGAGELDAAVALPDARVELKELLDRWLHIHPVLEQQLPAAIRDRAAELRRLAEGALDLVVGDELMHVDLRLDNVLIDRDRRVRLIDWPWAARGRRWFDGLTYLLDARRLGAAFDVDALLRASPLFADVTDRAVDQLLAALIGYFSWAASRPAPPELQPIRVLQQQEGAAAFAWLDTRQRER